MKMFTLLSSALLVPAMLHAKPATELESLRQRCAQQQNHITILENRVRELEKMTSKDPQLKAAVQGKPAPSSKSAKPSGKVYTVVAGDTLASIARRNGTTISQLSQLNKISDPRRLSIGQSLVLANTNVPAPQLKTATAAAPKAVPVRETKAAHPQKPANYTIKPGDTFYGISRVNKVKLSLLEADNPNVNASSLKVGQKIHVRDYVASRSTPKKAATTTKSTPKPAVKKSTPKPAPVKKSSPRPSVAKKSAPLPEPKFEAKTEAIRSIKVSSDITFGSLAANHGVTTTQLNELNGLNLTKSTLLAKGSELYVPSH